MIEPDHTSQPFYRERASLIAIMAAALGAGLIGIFVTESWAARLAITVLAGATSFFYLRSQHRIRQLCVALDDANKKIAAHLGESETLRRAESAEAERHELVQRLSIALNAAGVSMWEWRVKDDECRVLEGSSFAQRLGGRTTYRGTEYAELVVHPDERKTWLQVFLDGISKPPGDDQFSHRYRAIYPNGSLHWIQFQCRVMRNTRGMARTVIGVDWDVTAEVEAAAEIAAQARQIAETEARLMRAVGGTQDALFDLHSDMQKSWIAPRFYSLLGYDEHDFKITTEWWNDLVHPDDQRRRRHALREHMQSQAPFDIEYRLRKKDGEWLWVRTRGVASTERDSQGRAVHFSGAVQDITAERVARETLMLATHAAEEASRAKSAFLATMSHEIRTPINGIMGMTTLLLDSKLDPLQRDYAQTVLSSADSLLAILNDVLDFSKIEAGKLEIEAIEMDLVATVEDIGALMAFQCAAKNLELIVNIHPGVPESVIADPQRIRQCLLNLVGNAIKFTQRGEISIEVFSVGQQNGQTLVQFEVRDTGLGIEPGVLQKLFQPFTQADSSTTRRYGGTGLGLSIVRRLVELMAGQVGAQSEPGKGSLFWFTLPCAASNGRQEKPAYGTPRIAQRVLLVDDNETNRRVLAGQLVNAGYEVTSAASGAQALAIMRECTHLPFDLVLLDFEMPEMDGATLGAAIMNDVALQRTRLVMLTSLDRGGDVQRFSDIGFAAYLPKPIRRRELLSCLSKVLGHEPAAWHMRSQSMITRGRLPSIGKSVYEGKVLIAEDNAINQRVAKRFLERLGCEVQVVDDGAKAVDACNEHAYSLVLMDMQMPVMDGLEATRRIRVIEARKNAGRTPIVALTANAHAGQMELCVAAGMDDYLTKPLDIDRLQNMLDRYVTARNEPRTPDAPSVRVSAPETSEPLLTVKG